MPGDQPAGREPNEPRERVGEVVRGRDDVGGDVHGQRRDDRGEHRDGDDDRRLEARDQLDRIPDHLAVDDRRRARDQHAHRREHEHRRRQRHDLADDLLALAAAEPREVRHVERQRRPEPDHGGQRRHEHRQERRRASGTSPAARAAARDRRPSRSPRRAARPSSPARTARPSSRRAAAGPCRDTRSRRSVPRRSGTTATPSSEWPPNPAPSRPCQPGTTLAKNVFSASPPIQAWMPNQPHATSARISAGTFDPNVPYAARANTGNGMPYFVPGCEFSRIGMRTIVLPRSDRERAPATSSCPQPSARPTACRSGCSAPC